MSNKITVNQRLLEVLQYAQGASLSCDEIKALMNSDDPNTKAVFGSIQSLNYGTECSDMPQLQKVMVSDFQGETQLLSATDNCDDSCVAHNLDDFERVLKNAADFDHEIFAVVNDKRLTSVTLKTSSLDEENFTQIAFRRAKRGRKSSDD